MKVAITGGSGFLGRALIKHLRQDGDTLVVQGRSASASTGIPEDSQIIYKQGGLESVGFLAEAFEGCDAVAHLAGINREVGRQTYTAVHIDGTRNVVAACKKAGVKRLVLTSFLRARPDCGSSYHESKWKAEELVRKSGLDYTVLRPGVVFGPGDHMVDHIAKSVLTFPVFGLVGVKDSIKMRPIALADMAVIIASSLKDERLRCKTVDVVGPEELTLKEAVNRVSSALGKRPLLIPMPVNCLRTVAMGAESLMKTPFISVAQLAMLSEGLSEALPVFDSLPEDLLPQTRFTEEEVRKSLPARKGFGWEDMRLG